MNREELRQFAEALLNDEWGINEQAYHLLSNILKTNGCEDILMRVCATDGRFYLPEGFQSNWHEDFELESRKHLINLDNCDNLR